MTEHRRDTWAAKRQFNSEAAAPPDLQIKRKRRAKKTGKRAQLIAAMMDEFLELRTATDRLAAAVLNLSKPRPRTIRPPENL